MNEKSGAGRKRQKEEEEEEEEEKQGAPSKLVAFAAPTASTNPNNNSNNNPGGANNEAMMNDVILKHMFELVDHRELNTFRQVCSHWYQVSLPAWLKSGPPIALKTFDTFAKFVEEVHASTQGRRSNCPVPVHLQRINGIQRYPKFHVDHGAEASEYQNKPHVSFWKLGGQWLTHLTVRFSGFTLREITILSCNFAPKLEYLDVAWKWSARPSQSQTNSVDGQTASMVDFPEVENKNLKEFHTEYTYTFPEEPVEQPSAMEWKSLLGRFPNLEHFHVGTILSEGPGLEKILKSLNEIRRDDRDKLKLKSLICHSNGDYKTLGRSYYPQNESSLQADSFRQLRLELHSFRVDFGADDSDESVNSILSTWAASLKTLQFHRRTLHQNPPFHQMGQLQTLTLAGYLVPDLAFLAHLPNLQSLTLWEYSSEGYDYNSHDYGSSTAMEATGTPDLTCPSLTQFGCNYDLDWDVEDVTRLHQLMPNLTRLGCCLWDGTLRLVSQLWPRLEHLCVYGDHVGDFGIRGIRALSELSSFKIKNLDSIPSFEQPWNRNMNTTGTIRPDSVNAFLQLPRLNKLVILTHETQLDLRTAALIRNEIPFSKVEIHGYF